MVILQWLLGKGLGTRHLGIGRCNGFSLRNMVNHRDVEGDMNKILRRKEIPFAGNKTLKIYGRLDCDSGKRMKKENRVFFANEDEALNNGYRPCGKCLPWKYFNWKQNGSLFS